MFSSADCYAIIGYRIQKKLKKPQIIDETLKNSSFDAKTYNEPSLKGEKKITAG